MGIKKKMLTVCLAILLIPTLVYAIEQKNYFDINMMENDIYNVTYLNATYFYQDGTAIELFNSDKYFNKSDIEGFSYYNASDFSISDYFTKSQINSFDYWNDTYATFNKTYADTLYYLQTQIDTQGEVEAIWGISLATDTEVSNTNTKLLLRDRYGNQYIHEKLCGCIGYSH